MTPQRILFLAEGQLGDLLLLTQALRAVKESFPFSFITVLVLERRTPAVSLLDIPPESSVLAANKHIDEFFTISRQSLRAMKGMERLRSEYSIIRLIRQKKFDTVICTFPEDRFAIWAFASGARIRVGQRNQAFHMLLTTTPGIEKHTSGVLEYYCDLVREIGATVRSKKTEYAISEDSKASAERLLQHHGLTGKKLVAVHPGATGDYKIWLPERYALLIEHLSKNVGVLLLGSKLDHPIIMAIKQRLHTQVAEIEVDWKIGNLAALLQRCVLCISNDSGPRHLSIAVGTKSLALFRQHHDKEWGVYEENENIATVIAIEQCPACPHNTCLDKIPEAEQFASHCMRMIRVDEVVGQAEKMLG